MAPLSCFKEPKNGMSPSAWGARQKSWWSGCGAEETPVSIAENFRQG